jgi:Ser-tRNA(Ala) deacylase AlaX
LILEETIFHPQGGGQPSDVGIIENEEIIFKVEKASTVDGHVEHLGEFSGDSTFKINDKVKLKVDKESRDLNTRLHSAGHLIDVAVRNIG